MTKSEQSKSHEEHIEKSKKEDLERGISSKGGMTKKKQIKIYEEMIRKSERGDTIEGLISDVDIDLLFKAKKNVDAESEKPSSEKSSGSSFFGWMTIFGAIILAHAIFQFAAVLLVDGLGFFGVSMEASKTLFFMGAKTSIAATSFNIFMVFVAGSVFLGIGFSSENKRFKRIWHQYRWAIRVFFLGPPIVFLVLLLWDILARMLSQLSS